MPELKELTALSPTDKAAFAAVTESATGRRALAPYLGLVASRCRVPIAYVTGSKELNSRTFHVAMDNIAAIGLLVSNWYQLPGGNADAAIPGTTTYYAAVEYPIGTTPQRVTWGGSQSLAASTTDLFQSDLVTLTTPIPRGARFIVRFYISNTAGIAINSYASNTAAVQDGNAFAASYVGNNDLTLNQAAALSNGGGNTYFPAGIIGMTQRPTVAISGDSLNNGSAEFTGTSAVDPLVGLAERWVGANFAFVNMAQGGNTALGFTTGTNTTARQKLFAYVSDVLANWGMNDLAGNTVAVFRPHLVAYAAVVKAAAGPAKRLWLATVSPRSTSTDGYTTLAGQTTDATQDPRRREYNNDLRGGALPTGVDGYFEVADALEPYRDAGVMIVSPTARAVTDGAMTAGAVAGVNNVLTSATAAFTSRDVGTGVYVVGAGASGVALTGFIGAVTATTATIVTATGSAINAGTTVSGATAKIGALSGDGVHFYAPAYRLAAPALTRDAAFRFSA